MTSIVKEVIDAQKESDRMFLEMEEKRLKHEADQRQGECDFQLRMMSMLFGDQGCHNPPNGYGPAYQSFTEF